MKINNVNISLRLFLGFSLVVALTIFLGVTTLIQFKTLSSFTADMHNHPMVVSSAVRDIKVDLYHIQYNIEMLTVYTSESEFMALLNETDNLLANIENNFQVLRDKFLGDIADVEKAERIFDKYRPIINRMIYFLKEGEIWEAVALKNEQGNLVIEQLILQADYLGDFAYSKSEEFYQNAVETSSRIFKTTMIFLVVIVVLSIVVGRLISNSVIGPLKVLMRQVLKLSVGDQDFEIDTTDKDEIGQLSNSIFQMKNNSEAIVRHAKLIAYGDYSGEIEPRSDSDELAKSLNRMTRSLNKLEQSNYYSYWLKNGQNLINEKMVGDKNLKELSISIINSLSEYVGAKVGAIYLYNGRENQLKMSASYAYPMTHRKDELIKPGDGILGQVIIDKKIMTLTDIPQDYMDIKSGLGSSIPNNIIVVPLMFNDVLKGVIELGAFKVWNDRDMELFNSLSYIIGVAINSSEARDSMAYLFEQQKKQSEELIQQQEELRVSNEELEENTNSLINQKDEIKQKNEELEIVKQEIMKKAEDLEISSNYKSEFLANMSHELRTPLNSLLILSKDLLMNNGKRLNKDDLQSIEIINNSGNELLQLINEVLDLSKVESGQTVINSGDILIEDLAQNIKDHFSKIAIEKGIELRIITEQNTPKTIYTDYQKINQIIKNLVSNAIKFTKTGYVSVRFKGNMNNLELFLIEVEDTGIGIAEEKHNTIFDAFKQADGSTSREYGGTGLGLSISRELTHLLGGEISLKSNLGKGSTFRLNMEFVKPEINSIDVIKKDKDLPIIEEIGDNTSLLYEGKYVLIVDDDMRNIFALSKILEQKGMSVFKASNGKKALEILDERSDDIDLILMDIMMPVMNGYETMIAIRNNEKFKNIPILALTAKAMAEDRGKCIEAGANDYMTKPVDPERLFSLMRVWL